MMMASRIMRTFPANRRTYVRPVPRFDADYRSWRTAFVRPRGLCPTRWARCPQGGHKEGHQRENKKGRGSIRYHAPGLQVQASIARSFGRNQFKDETAMPETILCLSPRGRPFALGNEPDSIAVHDDSPVTEIVLGFGHRSINWLAPVLNVHPIRGVPRIGQAKLFLR